LENALEMTKDAPEIMIVGGAEIYKLALKYANKIYLTQVEVTLEGDTYFPPPIELDWEVKSAVFHPKDEKHCYNFTFIEYWRKLQNS
jgi:dihydrofolate reductase